MNLHFFATALRDYKIGALTRSSKYVIRHLLKHLKPSVRYVVEYGAGDGVVTEELLKVLPEDGIIYAIDTNETFVADLKKIGDPRVKVIHADVVEVMRDPEKYGIKQVDAVLSGIPFSFLGKRVRDEIARETYETLAENGQFFLYQTSPLMVAYLQKYFPKGVSTKFEIRNFPPYFLMKANK